MIEVGRQCVKIAGRDAGKRCIIVEVIDKNKVLIDGETRRRKCSIRHIEPLHNVVQINSGAPHDVIVSEFRKLGIEIKQKVAKERTAAKQETAGVKKPAAENKEAKKAAKK